MIVDCHTHWAACHQNRDGHDPSRWLAALQNHGVTCAVVLPTAGLSDDTALPRDNDDVASVCALSDGRMIPFCTVNPWSQHGAVEELRRCLEQLRVRGIKFHPWLQGISPSSSEMDRLCEIATEFDVPILFHDGTPPFSLPSQIALLARRHRRARFVLGHCGLFEHWREAIAALNSVENLWGCLCGPHVAALTELVGRCDRDRLVWGSDYGFSLADVAGYRKGLLDLIDVSDLDRDAIFARNPTRLLRLSAAEAQS